MCGIAGIFQHTPRLHDEGAARAVRAMTRLLARRGPDDEGFWDDHEGRLYLGFRRLSILDLSPAAAQPMVSADGRAVLVFNGEIYNFRELRHELEQKGARFRTTGDAEVLLEALNCWGVAALDRLNGMFAFAWYDRAERKLLLARDHAGIKPLYYFQEPGGRGLAFASQYNALLHTPWGEPGPVRQDVLRLFLRLHHIPPPYGLLANTYQLEPGHYLLIDANGTVIKRAWWRLPEDPEPDLSDDAARDALREALSGAIRRQRIADVPLGVFLSGGVDSPLVTSIAREQTGPELKAFTIGNPGWEQDEAADAVRYGNALDVDHRVHNVSGEDAAATIRAVIEAQHEPFADASVLPTLWVSGFARREVTVALSGDGGDELFFGYTRPVSLLRNGADFRWPRFVRMALYGAGKYGLGPQRSDVVVWSTPGHYYFDVNTRVKDDSLKLLAPGLAALPEDFDLYAFPGYKGKRHLANYSRRVEFYGQLQRMLKKVDMASMYQSLEVRVPLLDREVLEVSLRIDPLFVMRNGTRKALLRDLLAEHVPAEMIPQPKRGFAIPLKKWLRGPLRSIVEETLFDRPPYPEGIFDRPALEAYWRAHVSGEQSNGWGLWTLLALQWWAQEHLQAVALTSD